MEAAEKSARSEPSAWRSSCKSATEFAYAEASIPSMSKSISSSPNGSDILIATALRPRKAARTETYERTVKFPAEIEGDETEGDEDEVDREQQMEEGEVWEGRQVAQPVGNLAAMGAELEGQTTEGAECVDAPCSMWDAPCCQAWTRR